MLFIKVFAFASFFFLNKYLEGLNALPFSACFNGYVLSEGVPIFLYSMKAVVNVQ